MGCVQILKSCLKFCRKFYSEPHPHGEARPHLCLLPPSPLLSETPNWLPYLLPGVSFHPGALPPVKPALRLLESLSPRSTALSSPTRSCKENQALSSGSGGASLPHPLLTSAPVPLLISDTVPLGTRDVSMVLVTQHVIFTLWVKLTVMYWSSQSLRKELHHCQNVLIPLQSAHSPRVPPVPQCHTTGSFLSVDPLT